ncbi:TonB-dependent receptor [Hephaestia sp. GCM10023244]|uniref:TonB-dependent receptor n=1 Tax=unclassified Hephaestia TaxID=2631281 RepID=UPI00207704E2|nr:TonB-dependent receptor [Hephaestia sp. MAHUQ-44]MCM8729366.1 TonB-dependent receptor [Hephaestia sp. MAHUQ-44]
MLDLRWRKAVLLQAVAGVAMAGAVPAAIAQTAGADPQEPASAVAPAQETSSSKADAAGDIIVTAQRRSERLQDVPLSVAVVQGDTIDTLKFNESSDLQYLVPGVTAFSTAGPRNFGFFVRGIGTSSFSSEAIEASTAYVLDGVVLGQAGASVTDLPDVERIEVLRGPQGTLFGKNASAGVVNVITRSPSETLEVRGSASWGWPDNDRRFSLYVSGPINDVVRFSVSGRRNLRDGHITNVFDGRRLNGRDDYGFRGKIEMTPTSDVTITMIGDYYARNADCCLWTFRDVGSPPSATEQLAIDAGIVPGARNEKQNVDGEVRSNATSYGGSLQVDWGMGDYMLTSISALREWNTSDGLDSDSSPLDLLNVNFANFFRQSQFSQELRIASPTGKLIDFVAGAYYFVSNVHSNSEQFFPQVPLPFFARDVYVRADTENMALFGQANLHITEAFKLIGGVRVVRETIDAAKRRTDYRLDLADAVAARKETNAVVWRGGMQYTLSPDANVFATVTRGFKGGGFDTNIGNNLLREVEPERPTNYEVGVRTSWPGAGLTFNVTGFWMDVENYQTAGRDAATSTYPITSSKARTKGVEVEIAYRPRGTNLTLNANGSYVDARWGDFPNAPCYSGQTAALGCVSGQQDLTGFRLPFSPEWQFAVGANYVAPVSDRMGLAFDLGANYRSATFVSFPNHPDTVQDGYLLLNGSIGLVGDTDRWRVSVYAKNLLDQHFVSAMFATPFGTPQSLSQYNPYEARRSVGVSLDVAF